MEMKEGYQQTEVGEIPEDWDVTELTNVSVISRLAGAEYTSFWQESPNGEIIALRGYNIGKGRLIDRDLTRISNALSVKLKRSRLCRGDVIYPCVGSIGNAAVIDEDNKYHIQQNIARITPDRNAIDSYFLAYYLMSFLGGREVERFNASSSQPSVLVGSLRQYRVPLPPTKAEQEAIAESLSDADALIESLEQLIAKKRQIKQGAMQELLTGRRRISGFSGKWEETTVAANILKSFCGPSPTCEERNIDGSSEWGVLKTTAITWENGWDWKRHKTLPQLYWNQPGIELCKGDVLVTKAGPRHRVGVSAWINFVPDQIIPSGKMIALRPDPRKAVPLMLSAAIAAPEAQSFLDQRTTGMAESQVNYENTVLLDTPIKLPTYDEQTVIATILGDLEAEIVANETKLTKARQVKQGMMQELLTGNIRLIQPGKSHA